MELHDLPMNIELQSKVLLLRKQAIRICDAKRSFYYQQAKCAYLSNDKCMQFFPSLVKRNENRNFIVAAIKKDGTPTNSLTEVEAEFLGYYQNLLVTNNAYKPIDRNILGEGPLLSVEHAESVVSDVSL